MLSERKLGYLLSNTEINPRENVHAIFVSDGDEGGMKEEKARRKIEANQVEQIEPKKALCEYKPWIP